MEQGAQPISQVVTQMGVFEATDKHKIAVISDVSGGYSWKKLHELEPGDRMVFVDRLIEGVATEFPSYRITSYNVCYTKLLREAGKFLSAGILDGTESPGKVAAGALGKSLKKARITSYNVCYTKLLRYVPPKRRCASSFVGWWMLRAMFRDLVPTSSSRPLLRNNFV